MIPSVGMVSTRQTPETMWAGATLGQGSASYRVLDFAVSGLRGGLFAVMAVQGNFKALATSLTAGVLPGIPALPFGRCGLSG
jgi:hypothetical protein